MPVRLIQSLAAVALLALPPAAAADKQPDDAFFRDLVESHYVRPFREGNIACWIQAFDDGALGMHNHRPMDRGRDAIEAFGQMVHQHFELQEYAVEVTEIRRSDQWVYTVGQYRNHFVSRADGSSPHGPQQGKFVLLWEQQADGQWRIILDMGNSNR